MKYSPQVSVVIPAYNAERFISEALGSIFCQRCDLAFEVIVVDDGSTDRTATLIKESSVKECRLKLVESTNKGPGSARNLGVKASSAEIILFLDADDKMLPDRLQHQGRFMLDHPEVSVCFGDMIVQGSTKSPLELWGEIWPEGEDFIEIRHPFNRLVADGCYVCNAASAVRREHYLTIGMQREDLRVAEDFDLWCRLAAAGHRFSMSRRQYSWLRREGHGNLMASPHAYRGPTVVLAEQLRFGGKILSSEERARAQVLLDLRANMYLRYLWACDRSQLDAAMDELEDVVSPIIVSRWRKAKIIPPWVGSNVRRVKSLFR